MKNFIQPGDFITVPAPADVASGQMVAVGSILGVAEADAATGANVTLARKGVFSLPKTAAQAWTVGDKLYWNATNAVATTTATGNTLIGAAVEAAANPSDTGVVLLDGAVR